MDDAELEPILLRGASHSEMSFNEVVIRKILTLSEGFPHFTHLLGKFAAICACKQNRDEITDSDLTQGINLALENAQQSIQKACQLATFSIKGDSKFEDVLSACALAETDQHGTFSTKDTLDPYERITKQSVGAKSINYNLRLLCEEERGLVLGKHGHPKKRRYSFRSPLLKAFVRLKLYQKTGFYQRTLNFRTA